MRKAELIERVKPVPLVEQNSTLSDVLLTLCESIDSPRSLSVWLLFRDQEHDQLLELECRPVWYNSAEKFADDYLITSFLSKYPYLKVSFDPEEVAMRKFLECETLCKETNQKFRMLRDDPSKWDPRLNAIFRGAKRRINRVLGRPDLVSISKGFGWGPGATSAAKGSQTTAYDKFCKRLDVTSNGLIMGHCCVNSTPAWVNCQLQTDCFPSIDVSLTRDCFSVVRGNEIVFVPKNAKTHRTIAIEPHVNSYLQKGFGGYIRKRLRVAADVDLNDQSYNQRLAREGSLTGALATIDLSGASDTISKELVKELLPEDWFSLLDSIRSKQGYIRENETWINYEKFSSMGNGFTFELETLIFWALCKECLDAEETEGVLNVYGDDIIAPVYACALIAEVLTFAGFKFNVSKTFVDGPFRESCGKDFYLGHDVRPIFIKERIANVESIYKLANSIRRYSHRRNFNYGCDRRFLAAWHCLRDRLDPAFLNLTIPEGYGDGGLIVNFDEATPSRCPHGWQGWFYKSLRRMPLKTAMRDGHGGYVTTLSVIGSEEPLLGFVSPRDKTYPRIARGHTWEWYDLGPWC